MKNLIKKSAALLFVLFISFGTKAQNAVKTNDGNYTAIKHTVSDSTHAKFTGKTFKDAKGVEYPVIESANNKLYVLKISKSGNMYKMYLHL